MLLLSLIPLPILLIQCSCSLCFCSLCAVLGIPLHPMFRLPMLQLFMPCSLYSYFIHPCFDLAPYSPSSLLLFLTPLLPMLLLCIPLHPMFLLPMLQLFMPFSLCSYSVPPFFWSSFLFSLFSALAPYTSAPYVYALYPFTSYFAAWNATTLSALLPLLLLRMSLLLIPLPIVLIQCSSSLCLCSLWASASYNMASYVLASYAAFNSCVSPSPYILFSLCSWAICLWSLIVGVKKQTGIQLGSLLIFCCKLWVQKCPSLCNILFVAVVSLLFSHDKKKSTFSLFVLDIHNWKFNRGIFEIF